MTFTLNVKNTWVDVTDENGNRLYGFIKDGSYELVGATFNGFPFTKEKISWKRDKRGQVSKAFYAWEEVARKELYEQFFNAK